jgi:hypothetical protein
LKPGVRVLYEALNARNIEQALSGLYPDVEQARAAHCVMGKRNRLQHKACLVVHSVIIFEIFHK